MESTTETEKDHAWNACQAIKHDLAHVSAQKKCALKSVDAGFVKTKKKTRKPSVDAATEKIKALTMYPVMTKMASVKRNVPASSKAILAVENADASTAIMTSERRIV